MSHPSRFLVATTTRCLAVVQIFALVLAPGCAHPVSIDPIPGVLDYRGPLQVHVPGAVVDVAGGNLHLRRVDLTLETLVTTVEIGAVYNSTSRSWLWAWESSYDGTTFVDPSGAVHDVTTVADGEVVPGTHWVKLDATQMETKGGLTHTFDPNTHRLTRLHWRAAGGPFLSYDVAPVLGVDRVVGMSQCLPFHGCTPVFDIRYTMMGCVREITDRAGRVADYTSDDQCRPVAARDGFDVAQGRPGWRYTYEAGLLTSATNSEAERTAYRYLDGRLTLVWQQGDGVRMTSFEYGSDASSGLHYTRVVDPRGGLSTFRYDDEGRLHRFVDAVGDETTYIWNGLRPAAVTDAAGATTATTWLDDAPVSLTLPTGNVLSITYADGAVNRADPHARAIARITDSIGLVETRGYDGWLTAVGNGEGEIHGYGRNWDGTISEVNRPDGTFSWLADHGEHGYAAEVITSAHTDYREFDAVGDLVEGTDIRDALSPGRPGIRKVAFDGDRNVRTVERVGHDALGDTDTALHLLEIDRRSDGRVSRITRPYGADTEHVYDGFGDLVERREIVDGVWQVTRFEYDAAGNLIAVERPNGMRRELQRDAVGRVTRLTLLQDGVEVQSMQSVFVQGRLVSRLDSVHGAPELFAHDGAGRVVRIVHPRGEVTDIDYDARSREVRRTYRMAPGAPPVRTIERAYDLADREIELRDDGVVVLSRSFSGGHIDTITYGNGLVRTHTYDPTFGLLTNTKLQRPGVSTWIEETQIGYAQCLGLNALCLGTQTNLPGWSGGPPAAVSLEGYRLGLVPNGPDPLGTPGATVQVWQPENLALGLEYDYGRHWFDALGNWLGVSDLGVPKREMTFNAERNRLLSVQGDVDHTYAWDAAGFLVERDGDTLTWSPNGRPTSIGPSITLQWDSLGRQVSSTIDGVTTTSLFGGEIVGDANGLPLGLDLDEVSIDLVSGNRLYRHLDFRKNIMLVTDDAGDPVLHHTYGPFGVEQTYGTVPDDRTFAGGRGLGGFLLLGSRLYDPAIGRFISPDPIYQYVNQFSYTLGNPVFLWDPTGGHAEASGVTTVTRAVATWFLYTGPVVMGTGLVTFNMSLSLLGASMTALGAMLDAQLEGSAECGCSVRVDVLTDGRWHPILVLQAGVGSRKLRHPREAVVSTTCSPMAIATSGSSSGWGLVLVGVQLAIAFAFVSVTRRRSRRR